MAEHLGYRTQANESSNTDAIVSAAQKRAQEAIDNMQAELDRIVTGGRRKKVGSYSILDLDLSSPKSHDQH